MVQVKKYGTSKGKESENLPDRELASRLFFLCFAQRKSRKYKGFQEIREKRLCIIYMVKRFK